ncbi:monovalent cation/H+ antiporter subunit D [Rheinheimera sp. 4Y26]|uniref:monovalent cation/H+ antiporter subunit D n=1 Tax=Rheinheimera sp. 4Y26 TaxID=2977811 RepID=UPI0021B10CD9|nr:monovalent cation/H+ antiporter subunit D [Rheinheimera sp. 4Y26]MCT6699916.1 monovalent cation/H+ antiporter subunit D [Rheinheimera sp. 4Y26]
MQHAVIFPILVPLITGALLLLPPLQASVNKRRALGGLGLLLLLLSACYGLWQSAGGVQNFYLLGNWPAPFGIVLLQDKVSAIFVLLSTVLACCCWLYSLAGEDERGAYFQPLLQFLLMGIHGAFLTADLFNLFVFFEVLLISSYGLLLHGGGKGRTKAALHYVLLNLLGSALFLLALALLYAMLGSLNMQDMALRISSLAPQQVLIVKAAAGLLLLVFGLKAALLPLHFWLPAAYANASAAVAAMFAVMTKVGVYCVMRVFGSLFGDNAAELAGFGRDLLWIAGLATMLLAAVGVVAAQHLKLLVAYLVLLSAGSLLATLALGHTGAVAAVLYYSLHSTLVAAALFLLADLIAAQRGTVQDRLVAGRPLQQAWPLGVLFVISALAVVGMPPLSGFVAKIWLMQAATDLHSRIALWSVLLFCSLLVLIALTRAGSTLFWRVKAQAVTAQRADAVQFAAVGLLLLASPVLVLFGEPVMQFCVEAATQLQFLPNVRAVGGA